MSISHLTSDRFEAYFEFCQRNYPQRRHIPERFRQQVLANPLLPDPAQPHLFLAEDESGAIVGHFGLNPFFFHHQGERKLGYCGFDYFVEEAHRRGAGALLAMKALSAYRPFFAIGVSAAAEQIYLKLRCRTIGSLRRFLWLRSPLAWTRVVGDRLCGGRWLQPSPSEEWPGSVSAAGASFQRTQDVPSGWVDAPWPEAELTFARPPEFLRWRFFAPGRVRYGFYAGSLGWFVIRSFRWRGLHLLALVDYRPSDADRFADHPRRRPNPGHIPALRRRHYPRLPPHLRSRPCRRRLSSPRPTQSDHDQRQAAGR